MAVESNNSSNKDIASHRLVEAKSQVNEVIFPRRKRLNEAVVTTAVQLVPLIKLLDFIQPQVASESVFHTRRKKIQAHFAEVYSEIRTERPKRQALIFAFQALSELVREEAHDISKDELQQAAKEVVLATLKNAPGLINVAHQARLLS
ncbi:hypothetical protein [Hymenobacter sp. BT730]|uniref:hypothetical protein n=1 Tax=Hymenobacter sp. BT730 TaxID=3063332 RepID=UPI0026E034A8|nr:hypothetical protein [Hymenobacter sp. BT730]